MRKARRILLLCGFVAATAILGSCKNRRFNDAALKVSGGAVVDPESPEARAVVAVVSPSLAISCTGSLIEPEGLILTAGHCFENLARAGYPDGIYVYFGPRAVKEKGRFDPLADPAHTVPVSWAVRHHGYRSVGTLTRVAASAPDPGEAYTYPTRAVDGKVTPFPIDDIALVKFDGKPPSGFVPHPLWVDASDLEAGSQEVTLIGYGCAGSEDEAWGTLRFARTKAVVRGEKERSFAQVLAGGGESGLCQGDSGGPILFRKGESIFVGGVLSRGAWGGRGEANSQGHSAGIYTDPSGYASWIQGWIASRPCLTYATKGAATIMANRPMGLTPGVTVKARYLQGDSSKPKSPNGRLQVEVADGPLAGTVGVLNASDVECME